MVEKKIIKIMNTVRGLSKNQDGFNYKFVTGDKLLSYLRPLLIESGLMLRTEVVNVITIPQTYRAWDKASKQMQDKTEILYGITMRMTWTDTEDGTTMVDEFAGYGMNSFDKGFGSALTYGQRYYLLKTFLIPTDKDDVDMVATNRDYANALAQAINEMRSCESRAEIEQVWKFYTQFQHERSFIDAGASRTKELNETPPSNGQ